VGAGRRQQYRRELKHDSQLNLKPVGFIDDDPSKHGIRIHGLTVTGIK